MLYIYGEGSTYHATTTAFWNLYEISILPDKLFIQIQKAKTL